MPGRIPYLSLRVMGYLEGNPPTILLPPPESRLPATEGQHFSYQVEVAAPEPGLTYALAVAPAGMTIDSAGVITWQPSFTSAGPRTVKVVVTSTPGCMAER